jgi:hypothetical protein
MVNKGFLTFLASIICSSNFQYSSTWAIIIARINSVTRSSGKRGFLLVCAKSCVMPLLCTINYMVYIAICHIVCEYLCSVAC